MAKVAVSHTLQASSACIHGWGVPILRAKTFPAIQLTVDSEGKRKHDQIKGKKKINNHNSNNNKQLTLSFIIRVFLYFRPFCFSSFLFLSFLTWEVLLYIYINKFSNLPFLKYSISSLFVLIASMYLGI